MRVMCINDEGWYSDTKNVICEGPCYGEILEVIKENEKEYFFAEYYPLSYEGYYKCHFVILSNIDETQMERNYQDIKIPVTGKKQFFRRLKIMNDFGTI